MTKITKILTTIKLTPILTASVLVGVIFLLGPGIPINAEAATVTEWLECNPTSNGQPGDPICDLQTGIALNNLVSAPPAGPLVVLEPDTFEHTSTWESAPSANPIVLLPGPVTLNLLHTNLSENIGSNDICWSKHAILPDGSEITIVQQHCFENPLPVAGSICPFGAVQGGLVAPFTPDIPAACIAAAGVASETVLSLIVAPIVLPAGTVIELNISCPGASFLAVFFNNGIDVDGDGVLEFTTITEEEGVFAEPEAEKTWTKTDYNWDPICIENDPTTGVCIDTRLANITNPADDVLADSLDPPTVDGISDVQVHVKKNDKILNMNPGAIYALTTVDIKDGLDMLKVKEQYDECTDEFLELLNQKNLSRNVKVAVADSNGDVTEVTDRLYDPLDLGVVFVGLVTDSSATVKINDDSLLTKDSTVFVLVKFDDTLRGEDSSILPLECVNEELVTSTIDDVDFVVSPAATLRISVAP